MKTLTVGIAVMSFAALTQADPIFFDTFDNNDLATGSGPSINAGFKEIDNDSAGQSGSVIESEYVAVLTSGTTKNVYGMLSLTAVPLSNPGGVETSWDMEGYSLKNNAGYLAFTWQTSAAYDATPELGILLNMTNGQITVTSNGELVDDSQNFDVNIFAGSTNGFRLVVTHTPDSLAFRADVNDSGSEDISFYSDWSSSSPFKSGQVYHHGAFVNGEGNGAVTAAVDFVVTVPIPEPAVISLISLFGGGMIFSRRIFGRKKSDSNA